MSIPASTLEPKISLCMITKNEEKYIFNCLESVRGLVHEMIIVDTGSTDRTVDIAKASGAKTYHHLWQEDFSKHRNQSISYATGDWILILDADEVIAKRDLHRIKRVLETVRADGFFFTLRNYESTSDMANLTVNPGDYEEGRGFPGFIECDLIRLFKNDAGIFFSGQVHETVSQAILQSKKTAFNTGIPIHHYGKVRSDRIRRKQDSYLALGIKRLDENPRDPIAYKGLCDQLLELEMPQDALEIATRGLAVFPDMLALRFNRALALDRLDMQNEAQKEYLQVLAKQPDHLGACHNMSQIFFNRNQFKKTIGLLNGGIEKGLSHPAVFFLLGRAFAALGDDHKALDSFERVLELQPDYPDVNCHKALVYLNHNMHTAAVSALEKEIEISGNLIGAYSLLGQISFALNDTDNAARFFQKVLTLNPDETTAKAYLERISPREFLPQ